VKRLALLLALAAFAAGCGGGGKSETPSGEDVIRGWTEAMYKGDFDKAADYFAGDAIVQQQVTILLRTHEDAVEWGSSLPCRAKVTSVRPRPHGVLLASFELFPGRGGTCARGGSARVLFFIREGHIETWHQLPEAPQPEGQEI
jgi:hypothetical protein